MLPLLPRPPGKPELSHSGSQRTEQTGLLTGSASGGVRHGSGGFRDEVGEGLGTLVRGALLGVEQPPWAQADLSIFSPVLSPRTQEAVTGRDLELQTSENQPCSSAHAPPAPAFPLLPSSLSALPSFLCTLGRNLQLLLLGEREGGWAGGWEGTFLQGV